MIRPRIVAAHQFQLSGTAAGMTPAFRETWLARNGRTVPPIRQLPARYVRRLVASVICVRQVPTACLIASSSRDARDVRGVWPWLRVEHRPQAVDGHGTH